MSKYQYTFPTGLVVHIEEHEKEGIDKLYKEEKEKAKAYHLDNTGFEFTITKSNCNEFYERAVARYFTHFY